MAEEFNDIPNEPAEAPAEPGLDNTAPVENLECKNEINEGGGQKPAGTEINDNETQEKGLESDDLAKKSDAPFELINKETNNKGKTDAYGNPYNDFKISEDKVSVNKHNGNISGTFNAENIKGGGAAWADYNYNPENKQMKLREFASNGPAARGGGTELLKCIDERGQSLGAEGVNAWVTKDDYRNDATRKCYEKNGYEFTKRNDGDYTAYKNLKKGNDAASEK